GAEDDELDEVLQQQIRPAEQIDGHQREVEAREESTGEHVNDLDRKNGESPEDEEMHPAGAAIAFERLLADDELFLPEDVLDDRVDPLRQSIEARHRRYLCQNRETPIERSSEESERDREDESEY